MTSGVQQAVCARCETPIVDPTVQVVHSTNTYCCVNCSEAFESSGSGSDPKTLRHGADAFTCAHCGVAIVHEDTMESRGDAAYCCSNCAAMADRMTGSSGGRTQGTQPR